MASLVLRPVHGIANISTATDTKEHENLEEEPQPATTLSLALVWSILLPVPSSRLIDLTVSHRIQRLCVDVYDVKVVGKLARMRGEAEIGYAWNGRYVVCLVEAGYPYVFCLVLQFELQLLVLNVCQACLCWNLSASYASRGTACVFIRFAIIRLIVWCLSISNHGHDVWKYSSWSIVLVRIEEDAKTFELVYRAEYWSSLSSLACYPHCHSITMQIARAVDLERKFDLHKVSDELTPVRSY